MYVPKTLDIQLVININCIIQNTSYTRTRNVAIQTRGMIGVPEAKLSALNDQPQQNKEKANIS